MIPRFQQRSLIRQLTQKRVLCPFPPTASSLVGETSPQTLRHIYISNAHWMCSANTPAPPHTVGTVSQGPTQGRAAILITGPPHGQTRSQHIWQDRPLSRSSPNIFSRAGPVQGLAMKSTVSVIGSMLLKWRMMKHSLNSSFDISPSPHSESEVSILVTY